MNSRGQSVSDETVGAVPPELSRPFHLAELDEAPEQEIEIETTAAERKALAARYSLLSLDALAAQLTVRRDISGEIVVEGRLQADVVQECVITLEPVPEAVAGPIEQRYTLLPAEPAADLEYGPDDIEPPEPVMGEAIDLGELVAQYLSLTINPYPRAPDADAQADRYQADSRRDGPFAVLAKLREKGQS
jgi:uncharacterized metal-binding protein YceD (DUF177 family)